MVADSESNPTAQPARRVPRRERSRSRPVRPGRMPVSEFAFDRAGAGSPFGDDITFPLPADQIDYEHPAP